MRLNQPVVAMAADLSPAGASPGRPPVHALYTDPIMTAGQIAVLVASVACLLAVVGLAGGRRLPRAAGRRGSARWPTSSKRQTVPLVTDAHRVVGQAATEMERVGAVLDSTESVHATVDSASRLAYRAFANPVVKVLAVRAGAATGHPPAGRRRRTAPARRNGAARAADRSR